MVRSCLDVHYHYHHYRRRSSTEFSILPNFSYSATVCLMSVSAFRICLYVTCYDAVYIFPVFRNSDIDVNRSIFFVKDLKRKNVLWESDVCGGLRSEVRMRDDNSFEPLMQMKPFQFSGYVTGLVLWLLMEAVPVWSWRRSFSSRWTESFCSPYDDMFLYKNVDILIVQLNFCVRAHFDRWTALPVLNLLTQCRRHVSPIWRYSLTYTLVILVPRFSWPEFIVQLRLLGLSPVGYWNFSNGSADITVAIFRTNGF